MSQRKIIYGCPAYDVYQATSYHHTYGILQIRSGTEFACKLKGKSYYNIFEAGSLSRDDLEIGQTYEEMVDIEVKERMGHEVFLFPHCTMITSDEQPRRSYTELQLDQIVLMQGKVYKVREVNNNNLYLKPIEIDMDDDGRVTEKLNAE